jgi:hypothetical protein
MALTRPSAVSEAKAIASVMLAFRALRNWDWTLRRVARGEQRRSGARARGHLAWLPRVLLVVPGTRWVRDEGCHGVCA